MKYKAIALDLDGTLTDDDKNIPAANKEAIFKAIDAGVKVILASGRPTFGVTPVAKELELDKRGGYILSYNGGNIIDCETDKLMYEKDTPAQCIPDIVKLARENGVQALTYYGDYVIAENTEDFYVVEEARCNSATTMKVDDMIEFVNYPVAKILVVGKHENLLPVQEALVAKYSDIINVFFSMDYFLEIVPKGVAKDESLEVLLSDLGIKREELIACGDGMNDVPMLKYAGLSVAMENAYKEVKPLADYIAPTNNECGVAHVIDKFIFGEN